jgi:hypothetical protein
MFHIPIHRVISEADEVGGKTTSQMSEDSVPKPQQNIAMQQEGDNAYDDPNKMDERDPPAFVEPETNQQQQQHCYDPNTGTATSPMEFVQEEVPLLTVFGENRGVVNQRRKFMTQQQQPQQQQCYSSASSLSSTDMLSEDVPQVVSSRLQTTAATDPQQQLARMNSRESWASSLQAAASNSSQNSSRDWGWFDEDVHFVDLSGNNPNAGNNNNNNEHSDNNKSESKSSSGNGTYSTLTHTHTHSSLLT